MLDANLVLTSLPRKVFLTISDADTDEMFHYIIECIRFTSPDQFHLCVRQEANGRYKYPDEVDEMEEPEEIEASPEDILLQDITPIESAALLDAIASGQAIPTEEDGGDLEDN